jgi:hypothetical protein
MTEHAPELEAELVRDLHTLQERFRDEKFCRELYRALADRVWHKAEGPPGHIALSWKRIEELVNAIRDELGEPPLELDQTGGEGEVSRTVAQELGRLGWTSEPLDTSRHDPAHVSSPEDPPPAKTEPPEWERQAHAEADAARRRRV